MTEDYIPPATRAMITLRRKGLTYSQIGESFGISGPAAWERVHRAAPELTQPQRAPHDPRLPKPRLSPNAKPQAECHIRPFIPPATGSSSGFIRPIPLARLMGAKA